MVRAPRAREMGRARPDCQCRAAKLRAFAWGGLARQIPPIGKTDAASRRVGAGPSKKPSVETAIYKVNASPVVARALRGCPRAKTARRHNADQSSQNGRDLS